MNYPSIRIEGAILSPDILDRLEDAPGQRPADFGLESTRSRSRSPVPGPMPRTTGASSSARSNTESRLLGHDRDTSAVDGPTPGSAQLPARLPAAWCRTQQQDLRHLDRVTTGPTPLSTSSAAANRPGSTASQKAVLRMSAHAMVQEYLNLQDELYGLVTNGRVVACCV